MVDLMALEYLTVQHMGKLHPAENALVLLLAFGPILLLAVTIVIARRRAEAEEREKSERARE